jgi:hypothetical protein
MRFQVLTAASMKMTVLWPIALMTEAASASKTSLNVYQVARRNIPEDSHPHIRRRENLKSRQMHVFL